MILETGILAEFVSISKTKAKVFRSICNLYSWNDTTTQLKINRRPLIFWTLVLILAGSSEWTFAFHSHSFNNLGLSLTFGYGFFYFASLFTAICRGPGLLEGFISQIAKFELDHISGETEEWKAYMKNRPVVKIAWFTCKMIRISGQSWIPLMVGIASLLIPNTPMSVAESYPPKVILDWGVEPIRNVHQSLGGVFRKMFVLFANIVAWYAGLTGWGVLGILVVMGGVGLSTSILAFQRRFTKEQSVESVIMFRKVQLLTILFNKLISNFLVGVLIMCMLGEIVCILSVLRTEADLPLKLFFMLIAGNCMVGITVLFGFCGAVDETCKKCFAKIYSQAGWNVKGMERGKGKSRKEFRRMVQSLAPVKVHFGRMNFIEKLTPVVFQDFTTGRIIDLLLAGKSD